jgi:hypothetical protein
VGPLVGATWWIARVGGLSAVLVLVAPASVVHTGTPRAEAADAGARSVAPSSTTNVTVPTTTPTSGCTHVDVEPVPRATGGHRLAAPIPLAPIGRSSVQAIPLACPGNASPSVVDAR